jgi:lipoprotein-anchoring transpeptidase ErfK/SrfK
MRESTRLPIALLAAAMLLLGGCSSAATTTTTAPITTTTTGTSTTVATTTTTAATTTTADPYVLTEGQSLVAHADSELAVYDSPVAAAPDQTFPATTILGTPQAYLVLDGPIDNWTLIALPGRPNGASAWAKTRDLRFEIVDQQITVDLSDRNLTFVSGGEELINATVAIGSNSNPTPMGRFFVTDVVQLSNPNSAWGPFAVGLSGRSDTITEFNGGDGIIGIHGTNRPNTIGQPVSLGCVRLDNESITLLANTIRLGVPVLIQA